MSGSVQVILLLPLAMLVLLAAPQWSLLLWVEPTAAVTAQGSARVAAVLGGSAEDGREAGKRAFFNSVLGDATTKANRAVMFTTVVAEGAAIRMLPTVDVTVHQATRVSAERIR